jgi:putative tryptophan/tyrosine transport system substrate-binding protein
MRHKISHTKSGLRRYLAVKCGIVLFGILSLFVLPRITTAAQHVIIVQSGSSGVYEQFSNELQKQIYTKSHDVTIEVVNFTALNTTGTNPRKNNIGIYIAIGVNAAEELVKINNDTPKILSLIPNSEYEEKFEANTHGCQPQTCKVLTLDQPIKRQLKILHLALPNAKNILILKKDADRLLYGSYTLIAKNLGLSIRSLTIDSDSTLINKLKNILPNTDVLLALPNNSIYNSTTARPILLTTYKYGVPIFAYSQSFVDAGAVIGVYSTPAQYAVHTAEVVEEGLGGFKKQRAQAIPPKYFTIGANRSVAESLNIRLPAIDSLYLKFEHSDDE